MKLLKSNNYINAKNTIDFATSNKEASDALCTIEEATKGQCYLVGGIIRDSVFLNERKGDLDIMVENRDYRAYEVLDRIGVPYMITRHGNRRYQWNNIQIDLFEPRGFYCGFNTVEETIRFFDLKIDALAVHVGNKILLDPIEGTSFLINNEVGINLHRWNSPLMNQKEYWILIIRLVNIMNRIKYLKINQFDVYLLKSIVLRLKNEYWYTVKDRYPNGKEDLIFTLNKILSKRTI